MKELSIEEKAKAYDKVIEIAKSWYADAQIDFKKSLETLFPELKESEDERIRKFLITFFINDYGKNSNARFAGIKVKDIISWLEKQAQKLVWSEEDKNMLKWVIGYLHNKMLNAPMGEERTACKNAIAWFKKLKGEQKTNPCDGCINRKGCINCENGELRETEQKPADKVEPKFHEGDWVFIEEVKGYKNGPFQIKTVDSFGYSFDEYHTIPFMYEDLLSKWTIQDAKDGDVLTDGEMVVIFKQFDKPAYRQHIIAHIGLDICGDIQVTDGTWELKLDKVKPATKEQRDLLFQKMREAGYEWDAEKKELKKIEQKPTELGENRSKELSLSLQIQAYLNTASDELYAKGKPLYSEERFEDIHKCMLMWQKLHNAYFYHNPVEWSKEDEKIISDAEVWLDTLCDYLKDSSSAYIPNVRVIISKLKSLKDRVQP